MLNIVILAAGQGKRMQSDLPKVLHTIAGKPMLSHVLDAAHALAADQIITVVGHGAEQVRARFSQVAGVQFVTQQPQLGTGHAVQQAIPSLVEDNKNDVTMVLYGDVPLVQPSTLQRLLEACGQGIAILTEDLVDPAGYGRIVRGTQGQVVAIVEDKDASADQRNIREVNTGILAAPTALLKVWLSQLSNQNAQGEYYLTDVISMAVRQGVSVQVAHPSAAYETAGVNSRAQQAALERAWQAELAKRQLDLGITLADPLRFDQRGELLCGRDVFIDVGCVFEGKVVLADAVHIGAHCVLRDVTVGAASRIEAFSHLQQAVIGAQAQIGPYARLRPGAKLADRVHVGNFVEIKNTVLGEDAKAGHLAYLGDADIGARVNIGAGTITCNYDGVNKHRTIIGDDAFICSDTQLVAPVSVGKGATLGAGTTLTKDAPAQQLTISRTRQTTIAGWTRPVKKS
jgi:bifunctional UDP-N-acetylglucosamine pyrophosphorylase/glucosamine-1-phosphate N-acetyltransferase